jgi:two-component system sensor histidine kinase MtrB
VVATTLVVSAVVVLLLATLLLDQVGRGLLDAKVRSALSEARAGAVPAQVQLDNAENQQQLAVEALLTSIASDLGQRGATGDLYQVVLAGPPGTRLFASRGLGLKDVPPALLQRLGTASPAYVFQRVDGPRGPVDELVVGTRLSTSQGPYALVHLFPLTDERATYALVRRTAAAAGLLLVGLLALIAQLVTRQVVAPVRLASRTAQRLAAGRLEERMVVRGEDELTVLALSFNSMAASLQDQIRRLQDLSLLQRRFVSDVSHELRTPLTTVRMAADVLHEGRAGFPPHVARSAELLQAELDRFEELLVDLLEISRYDAGAASLDVETLDLVALTERALAAAEPLARRCGTSLVLHADGPVLVELDHVRMQRVLRNLVVNAIEHGEGLPVDVQVRGGSGGAAVVVRDHGVGLRPGDEDRVFTRFWRGDPSRARTTGGTGLGLAIAREDVRLHGGELDAWGEVGQGAAFRVRLPERPGAPLGPSPLPLVPYRVMS